MAGEESILASDYIHRVGFKWRILSSFQYHRQYVYQGGIHTRIQFGHFLPGYHHQLVRRGVFQRVEYGNVAAIDPWGIGHRGLLGPIAVYVFELNTLAFMGVLLLCSIPFYFYLETPEKLVNV